LTVVRAQDTLSYLRLFWTPVGACGLPVAATRDRRAIFQRHDEAIHETIRKEVIRNCGFEVKRHVPKPKTVMEPELKPAPDPTTKPQPEPTPAVSVRTNRLSFFVTRTGNYFLPTDAQADVIANAIKADSFFEETITTVRLLRQTIAVSADTVLG
jgi:hypothetical protein